MLFLAADSVRPSDTGLWRDSMCRDAGGVALLLTIDPRHPLLPVVHPPPCRQCQWVCRWPWSSQVSCLAAPRRASCRVVHLMSTTSTTAFYVLLCHSEFSICLFVHPTHPYPEYTEGSRFFSDGSTLLRTWNFS